MLKILSQIATLCRNAQHAKMIDYLARLYNGQSIIEQPQNARAVVSWSWSVGLISDTEYNKLIDIVFILARAKLSSRVALFFLLLL